MAEKWFCMEHHPSIHSIFRPGRENTFPELMQYKQLLKETGMLRIYKGKYMLSRECRDLLKQDDGGYRCVYPVLLYRAATRSDWSEWDGYPTWYTMQRAWLFVLYTLAAFGDRRMAAPFYAMLFRRAFPGPYDRTDRSVDCFEVRVLERFCDAFGLVSLDRIRLPEPDSGSTGDAAPSAFPRWVNMVRSTPLLKDAVQFAALGATR